MILALSLMELQEKEQEVSTLAIALQVGLNKLGANLKVDGVIGTKTLQALTVFGLLKLGSSGNLVKVLEGYLFIKNYNH